MRPRVLIAITVYDGRAAVPRSLRSVAMVSRGEVDVDVLVLDDCSPAPGWSEELAAVCADLGIQYYRSPRNLGIVRNVNLGLLRAVSGGYDAVIISNSDVIYPTALVERLSAVAAADPSIGSVTAWSNNVSIYSLPNADPDVNLASQEAVEAVNRSLFAEFSLDVVDIPAGISFCIYIPTGTIRRVGLMDPVFGRGYCEETDWTLRSLRLGHRLVLAPGVFVYHQGQVSTAAAGLVTAGHTTVPANEAVIDLRYPRFRDQVMEFLESGRLAALHDRALARLIRDAAGAEGYELDVTSLPRRHVHPGVRCVIQQAGEGVRLMAEYRGFRRELPVVAGAELTGVLHDLMGDLPRALRLEDRTPAGDRLAVELAARGVAVESVVGYPRRV